MTNDLSTDFDFPPFRLDRHGQILSRAGEPIALRPRTWEVLCHLVERRGALVSKAELLAGVWRNVAVSEDTLSQSIRELRVALGDDARSPRYIETVHGRGFRFLAPVAPPPGAGLRLPPASAMSIVGRDRELGILAAAAQRVRQGERRTVFVTGEAGIGKTALVEALLASPAMRGDEVVGVGHCLALYGPKDGFMPVLDALTRAFSTPRGSELLPRLRELAPAWAAQMPHLATVDGAAPGPHLTVPPMLREIAIAIEMLSERHPIVLVLEDLHWSDGSTIDLLSLLARRREPARLLLIGTFRPADAAVLDHPVRSVLRELRAARHAESVGLDYLTEADVHALVARRLGIEDDRLSQRLHAHTDGNPLFVNAILDDLKARGWVQRSGDGWAWAGPAVTAELPVPADLVDAIAAQLHRLPPDRQSVLEAASLSRGSFAAPPIADVLGRPVAEVEAVCQQLADAESVIRADELGEWPDGTRVRRFAFRHALYQRAIQATLSASRQQRLHQQLGEALERAWAPRAGDIATELAGHFDCSGDRGRAVHYLAVAATRLLDRTAGKEAVAVLERALHLLAESAPGAARELRERELRHLLGRALTVAQGYTAPGVRSNLERMAELCTALDDPAGLFDVEYPLWLLAFCSADRDAAFERAGDLARLAPGIATADVSRRAAVALAMTTLWSGDPGGARNAFERMQIDAAPPAPRGALGVDPAVLACGHLGLTYWILGDPVHGRTWMERALQRAEACAPSLSLGDVLCIHAHFELLCGDSVAARSLAQRAVTVCETHGFSWYQPVAETLLAAASPVGPEPAAALDAMEAQLHRHEANGARLLDGALRALVADACRRAGAPERGLHHVDEGIRLAETSLDQLFVAELWRLRGELLAERSAGGRRAAEESLHRAVDIARRQGSVALERRATLSLNRLRGAGVAEGLGSLPDSPRAAMPQPVVSGRGARPRRE